METSSRSSCASPSVDCTTVTALVDPLFATAKRSTTRPARRGLRRRRGGSRRPRGAIRALELRPRRQRAIDVARLVAGAAALVAAARAEDAQDARRCGAGALTLAMLAGGARQVDSHHRIPIGP